MQQYDKRPPRDEADALVRRRIDASDLRYSKTALGLAEADRLTDHYELVHIVRTEAAPLGGGPPYQEHRWGVKVNGHPAGYVSSNYGGTRHKFLPYWWGSAAQEVPA